MMSASVRALTELKLSPPAKSTSFKKGNELRALKVFLLK